MATTIVKTIVIREQSTPIKTIVVNRGPRGLSGTSQEYAIVTQTFNLSNQNILDKKVILSSAPVNEDITLTVDGAGAASIINTDFALINNREISWAGLRLEFILDNSDTVYISYRTRTS